MQECGGAPPGAGGGEEQAGGGRLAGAHLRVAGARAEGVRPADLSRLQGLEHFGSKLVLLINYHIASSSNIYLGSINIIYGRLCIIAHCREIVQYLYGKY